MMTMFLGSYQRTIDDKGRLAVPAHWQPDLAHGVVVTRGLEGCLFIFPLARFEAFAQAIDRLSLELQSAREWNRYMCGAAAFVNIDAKGQLSIPLDLRAQFDIQGDVMVMGLIGRIEIWNRALYAEMQTRIMAGASTIAEQMEQMAQKQAQ